MQPFIFRITRSSRTNVSIFDALTPEKIRYQMTRQNCHRKVVHVQCP